WGSYLKPGSRVEDRVPSPNHKSFHAFTTPTTRGRKRGPPELIPPRTVWNPNPTDRSLIGWGPYVWPTPAREDRVPPTDLKTFNTSPTPTTRGRKPFSPFGSIRPWPVRKHTRLLFNCGSYLKPAPRGEDRVPSPNQKLFHTFTTPTARGRKRGYPGSIPPRTLW
ncbi:unnamed protein product, partial [Laminaria digitata]